MDTSLWDIIRGLLEEHFFTPPMLTWASAIAVQVGNEADDKEAMATVLIERFILDCEERMMDVTLEYRDIYEGLRAEVMVNEKEYISAVTSELQSRDA